MNYKIGQILIAKVNYHSDRPLFIPGDKIEVVTMDERLHNYTLRNKRNGLTFQWQMGYWPQYLDATKLEPPKNDIEWLDRVKENFKNG